MNMLENAQSLLKDSMFPKAVESYLVNAAPAVLNLLLLFFLIMLVISLPRLVRALKKISLSSWLALSVIFITGAAFRLFFSPRKPQVFFDEISFMEFARNMAQTGKAQVTTGSGSLIFLPAPLGWETLLSWPFRLFGASADTAFLFNLIISCLTIVLVFLLGRYLLKSDSGGLGAAFLFAVLPVGLRIAGSAALAPSALFFILFSLWLLSLQAEEGRMDTRFLALFSILILVNIRQESFFFFLPVIFLFVLLFCRKPDFRDPFTYVGMTFFAYFTLPYFLVVWYGLSSGFYFFHESPEAIKAHVKLNYYGNALFFIKNHIHPAIITFLAGIGGWLLRKERRPLIFLLAWFLFGYLFYSSNPSCDLSLLRTLDSWRISLYFIAPLLFLGGYGLSRLAGNRLLIIKFITIFILIYLFLIPWQFNSFIHGSTRHIKYYDALKSMSGHTGEDPAVFTLGDYPGHDNQGLPYVGRWAIPAPRIAPLPNDPEKIMDIAKKEPLFLIVQGSLPEYYRKNSTADMIEEMEIIPGSIILRLYRLKPKPGDDSLSEN